VDAAVKLLEQVQVATADFERKGNDAIKKRAAVRELLATPDPSSVYEFASSEQSASDSGKNGVASGPCCFLTPTFDPSPGSRVFGAFGLRSDQRTERGSPWLRSTKIYSVIVGGGRVPEADTSKTGDIFSNTTVTTVTDLMRPVYRSYAPTKVTIVENRTLVHLGCPPVACPADCIPDLVWMTTVNHVQSAVGVIELKASDVSVYAGLQQVSKYAGAVAGGLHLRGVESSDIIVPAVCSNGISEQHVAVYLAAPTLPVPVVLSPVLDLLSNDGVSRAEFFRCKAKLQMEKSVLRLAAASRTSTFLLFAKGLYPHGHDKPMRPVSVGGIARSRQRFFIKSPALSDLAFECNLTRSLCHMFDVLSCVQQHDSTKDIPCYPLCFAKGLQAYPTSRSCLIFENLVALGYRSGLPDDKLTAAMFVRAFERVVVELHEFYLEPRRWDKWLLLATSKDPNQDLKKLAWDYNCINRLSFPGDECCNMPAALGH